MKGTDKQQNKTKCCDPLKYGYKIFLLLIWPLIALSIQVTEACIALTTYYQINEPTDQVYLEIILGITMLVSLTLVNYF